jgi:hypothetical protein
VCPSSVSDVTVEDGLQYSGLHPNESTGTQFRDVQDKLHPLLEEAQKIKDTLEFDVVACLDQCYPVSLTILGLLPVIKSE